MQAARSGPRQAEALGHRIVGEFSDVHVEPLEQARRLAQCVKPVIRQSEAIRPEPLLSASLDVKGTAPAMFARRGSGHIGVSNSSSMCAPA